MLAGALMLAPQAAQARVFLSVGFAPPAIPVYEQPLCPGDGYIWTPGYWQYTDDGYQWVDGAWVVAPYTGALWTPGYWGYGTGGYFWNAGYWGPTIGYYGGINYGFGYFGTGFYGGYWNGGHFFYNREYNHFGGGFHNDHVYSQRFGNFDGRPGGASFARAVDNGNRGGTFNNASAHGFENSRGLNNGEVNRNGFGQFGQSGQPNRIAAGSELRRAWNNGAPTNTGGTNGYNQNRGTTQPPYNAQPASNQPREGNGFSGTANGLSYARAGGESNNFHPAQGGAMAASSNVRAAAPSSYARPSQVGNFAAAQHSAPVASGGGFHGGGGGGFHGGGGRR